MGGILSSSSSSSSSARSAQGSTSTSSAALHISATDRAVLDLKNSRDRLSRYKQKLDLDTTKLWERAKECQSKGDKKTALNLMKLRKYKIGEAAQVEEQLFTVLKMVDTIVNKENEMEMLAAMAQGKDALEQLHREMSVDDVLQMMDEIEEQVDIETQINNILGNGLSTVDEAEVEEELAALEAAMTAETKSEATDVLPEVPTTELPEQKTGTEEKVQPPTPIKELVAG